MAEFDYDQNTKILAMIIVCKNHNNMVKSDDLKVVQNIGKIE